MSGDKQVNQPMDPTAKEGANPGHVVRNVRRCYALDTLVSEVEEAFGEAIVTYGEPDNWQVIHDVVFEVPDDTPELAGILAAMVTDERIALVDTGKPEDGLVLVDFHRNRRIMDTRDGFGIQAVLDVHREA